MPLTGEYFYSIAAFFSFSAYLMGNILWLRILLLFASTFYIISGVSLGISSMIGWNSAYLLVNLYHVLLLLFDCSAITLPEETRKIYRLHFSIMSTREFRKLILINDFILLENEQIIAQGEVTNKLYLILYGMVNVQHSGRSIAFLRPGDLVGEMSFMSDKPASASAVSDGVVQYAYWTHQDLERLRKKHCTIYNKFISIIGRDLVRKLNNKNEEFLSCEQSHFSG